MAGVQCSFERVEKKFVLTHAQAEALMQDLTAGYMAVDQYGQHTIRNLYYDTDDYALIRKSIQKPKYKVKFRLRAYGTPKEDTLIFAELKKKYSGVVYKRRIAVSPDDMRRFLRGETLDGDYLFGAVANSTSIAGMMKLDGEEVVLDDGRFELLLIPNPKNVVELQNLIWALLNQQYDTGGLIFRHVTNIHVETDEELPWSLDGEYEPSLPSVDITNHQRALTMLL